jgi:hypothetical protein
MVTSIFELLSHQLSGRSILCKIKEDERLRGGVVPEGHKQRYAAQGNEKSDAEIAQKWAAYSSSPPQT